MSTLEKYGYFDAKEGSFILTSEPPRKWVNLHYNQIGQNEIYSEITNIGDGTTWVRDDAGNTCTLIGYDAKYLYIRDEESGVVFCPGGAPVYHPVESLSCQYYAAKTVISSVCEGLRVTQTVFVPKDEAMEVWSLKIENLTDRTREISVFGYAMFQLTGCDHEGNYVGKDNYAVVYPEVGGVLITNRNVMVPTNRYKGYLMVLSDFKAGNGYRDRFLRSEFSTGTPQILNGYHCDNRPGYGPDCAGVIQATFKIAPNSRHRTDFLIGQTSSLEEMKSIRDRMSIETLDGALKEQMEIEEKRAMMFQIDIGYKNINALMNIFVKKQMYSYLINKSGFRDNLQLDYALAMVDYQAAEDNFLRALGSQMLSGSVIHGFRPLNRLQYSDKPAWILMTCPELIKESGNFDLLNKNVPYFESDEIGTVWDHMVRTMHYLANDVGSHGLCLQHHADWNDGLEATAQTGERESIMVTQQLCYGLLEMMELSKRTGNDEVYLQARNYLEHFTMLLNEQAWDGAWYVRSICEDGYRLGSNENEEGKIFINSQSWAVLSKTASKERAQQCMDSLEQHLGCDLGYRLVSPGFSKYDPRIGKMSNSMPGHAENGGCYNHAAGFKAVADCMLGRAEEAWETFLKVAPDSPYNPITQSEAEPFSFNNFYSNCEYVYGTAGYPWRTGTAAWFTIVLIERILGVRRSYDGLIVDPCLSKKIPTAKIERNYRGAIYQFDIDNTAGRSVGVSSMTVDGQEIQGNLIPIFEEGIHQIKIII